MDIWISGGFALVGALAGVFLSSFLTGSIKRKEARRSRIEEALRRTSAALAAGNFALGVGTDNTPEGVTYDDVRDLDRRLYIGNLERYSALLHDARHSVAMLAADGVDVSDSWRVAERFQNDLDAIYDRLRKLLSAS